MSIYQLAARTGAPPQSTLNDVLNGGAVPGLTVIYQIAFALGVNAFELLRERAEPESTKMIARIPDLYPSAFGQHRQSKKLKARRK